MNKKLLVGLSTILLATSLIAQDTTTNETLYERAWINIGYSNAKDVMLSGATVASTKGFSSLFSNPAGLGSNYAAGFYVRAAQNEHKNSTGSQDEDSSLATTQETLVADNAAVGLYYKSIVVEMKPDVHNVAGVAYGLETDYGLFSLGVSYLSDATTIDNYKTFGTGDYYTGGFQWQKSFIGLDSFYALYFGASMKGVGVVEFPGEQISRVSPKVQRVGFGVETNLGATTLLIEYDNVTQSWNNIDPELTTQALGMKWMMGSGLALGLGYSQSIYTSDLNLKDKTTMSAGLEIALWNLNIAIAALQKDVHNNSDEIYMQDTSLHADISFAF